MKVTHRQKGIRSLRRFAPIGAVLLALAGAGCSMPIADLPLVGLPEKTPARPDTPPAYLPVNDMPATRPQPVLTVEEQQKIEQELATARDRQATSVAKSSARRADPDSR